MKKLIDINGNPNKGDVLVFDGEKYNPVPKEIFLDELYKLKNKVTSLEEKYRKLYGKLLYDEGKITREDLNNGNY